MKALGWTVWLESNKLTYIPPNKIIPKKGVALFTNYFEVIMLFYLIPNIKKARQLVFLHVQICSSTWFKGKGQTLHEFYVKSLVYEITRYPTSKVYRDI